MANCLNYNDYEEASSEADASSEASDEIDASEADASDEIDQESDDPESEEPEPYPEMGDPLDETLDTSWVNKFKESENMYNDFYKEPVTSIAIYLLYVNKNNELDHIHRDRCLLETNGLLKRDIILSLIKRYQCLFSVSYKIKSLLRYNIDLDPSEINDFVNDNINDRRFIKSETFLTDIYYEDTIHMFQDLNSLFFIFSEERAVMNHTKRIALAPIKHKTKRNTNKKNLKIYKELV